MGTLMPDYNLSRHPGGGLYAPSDDWLYKDPISALIRTPYYSFDYDTETGYMANEYMAISSDVLEADAEVFDATPADDDDPGFHFPSWLGGKTLVSIPRFIETIVAADAGAPVLDFLKEVVEDYVTHPETVEAAEALIHNPVTPAVAAVTTAAVTLAITKSPAAATAAADQALYAAAYIQAELQEDPLLPLSTVWDRGKKFAIYVGSRLLGVLEEEAYKMIRETVRGPVSRRIRAFPQQ